MPNPFDQFDQPAAQRQPPAAGLLTPGNIDLNNRPVVKNSDGSISTVRSMGVNMDGKEVLIPTVSSDGGGILSDDDAIAQYRKTGQHLGIFDTPEHSTAYAQQLHQDQAKQYVPQTGARSANPFDRFDAQAAPQAKVQPEGGMLTRMWRGLTGGDASSAGSFGMGVADPVAGSAQAGSRFMEEQPIGYTAEQQKAVSPETRQEYVGALDKSVKQREAGYEEKRRQATPGINDPEVGMTQPKLGADWMRLLGNVASPANVVNAAAIPGAGGVAARGVPLAARLGNAARTGAIQGAIGGASQPVAGDNFAGEKTLQIGGGALGGAGVGAAGSAVGAGVGAAGRGVRDLIGGEVTAPADRSIQQGFARSVGIPAKGIQNAPDLVKAQENAAGAVRSIVQNKENLRLQSPTGTELVGQLPKTRGQFAEAVNQTKEAIFKKFDALAKKADTSTLNEPSPINKFNREFDESSRQVTEAQKELAAANRALTLAAAKQSRAGDNVYMSASANAEYRAAKTALDEADAMLQRVTRFKEADRANMSRPWVDLKPVASELRTIAYDRVTRNNSEAVARYALDKAETYEKEEAYTAQEAQRAIKQMNASLKAFYDNPSYDSAARASIDAMIANKMREGLDTMVEHATGAEYQPLKNEYGALSAVEKQVTRAALKGLNKETDSFLDHFVGVSSAEEVMRGMLTLNPGAATRGILLRVARAGQRAMQNPDRAVSQLFQGAERSMAPPRPSVRPGLPQILPTGAGGAVGDFMGGP